MCAVRSVDVIKALPFVQFGLEIYVALIAEKLVELLAVRAVRTLHLAVELGRATFDVGMADNKIRAVRVFTHNISILVKFIRKPNNQ